MNYKQLTNEQFAQYQSDPNKGDFLVRKWVNLPDDRYYTVSVWPEHLAGKVFVNYNGYRTVKSSKISKSNQPS